MRLICTLVLCALAFSNAAPFPRVTNTSCIHCPDFVALTASEKQEIMWERITASKYPTNPNNWYSTAASGVGLLQQTHGFNYGDEMNVPFDRFSDEYPEHRSKFIHTFGSVAKVKFIAEPNTPFTGLFKGASNGLIRGSLADQPEPDNIKPGMGLKLLRDGTYSGDVIAMYSLEGQSDKNWFRNQHKNWIPAAVGDRRRKVDLTFKHGAKNLTHLVVAHVAAANESGAVQAVPKYPDQIYFVPPASITASINSSLEFRDQLASVPSGSTLFEVWSAGEAVCLDPDGQPAADVMTCDGRAKMGELITTSEFVASKWGDEKLFFQHGRWATKERHQCKYAPSPDPENFLTNLFREAGTTDSLCIAGAACPNLRVRRKLVKTSSCPFDDVLKAAVPPLPAAAVYDPS